MKLVKLKINSFRNILEAEITPHEQFNVIVGNNAQGKTNILESIYLLGTMKSFRMARNSDLVTHGAEYSVLKGVVEKEGISNEITLSLSEQGKKAYLDRKAIVRPSDFFGNLNTVVFSPEDMAMVRGLPETRRKYLDRAVFSSNPLYLDVHHEYFKILKNRNALLKRGSSDGLQVWTERLIECGTRLMMLRATYLIEISNIFTERYASISGSADFAEIRYRSRIRTANRSDSEIREDFFNVLKKGMDEEIRRGTTLTGPHRDDLEFVINGKTLNHNGSQGEQRSFILALKISEIESLWKKWGNPPVLLLDDMTSELDRDRNGNFMEFLREKDMQVFITTTSLDNISFGDINNYFTFPVCGGKVLTEVKNV
jgi:DNA replication and repair protein RecF